MQLIQSSVSDSKAQRECREKTLEDKENGYCQGPFYNIADVSKHVASDAWVPTPRRPLVQGDKVRAIDAGNMSRVNDLAGLTERLQLPSTDLTHCGIHSMPP